jgi:hypothetical protein
MKTKLIFFAAALSSVAASNAQQFTINWHTIDGGGGTSTGGVFSVSGTIGQPDAGGPLTGGNYSLTGGFWAFPFAVQTGGHAAAHHRSLRPRPSAHLVDTEHAWLCIAGERRSEHRELGELAERRAQSRHRPRHAALKILSPTQALRFNSIRTRSRRFNLHPFAFAASCSRLSVWLCPLCAPKARLSAFRRLDRIGAEVDQDLLEPRVVNAHPQGMRRGFKHDCHAAKELAIQQLERGLNDSNPIAPLLLPIKELPRAAGFC